MNYTHDIQYAFEDAIGAPGANRKDFEFSLAEARKAVKDLHAHKKDNSWPVLNIGEYKADLKQIETAAKHIRKNFSTLVVFGMGASSCGGNTLAALAVNRFTGAAGKTKIYFLDNIDPYTFDQLLASIDLKKTMFLMISKSGNTAETVSQMFVLINKVGKQLGRKAIKDHFLFITEPGKNPMRDTGKEYGIEMLDHDPHIGGRYAALTAVGLLPAAVAGLNIKAIRAGAAEVMRHTLEAESPEPAIGAALHDALLKKGKVVSVMMPYCDRLSAFGGWHQQLWSESLGKSGNGTTALRALGALDQHSQLQLYLDGPRDKFFTLIMLHQKKQGAAIPAPKDKSLAYLRNHTLGEVMGAEQLATAKTLTSNKRPVRTFSLNKLDEKTMGALLMHFMLETIITAYLWNINAFDQPAVEESKKLTRQYLSNA